jgi:hypothetical protein
MSQQVRRSGAVGQPSTDQPQADTCACTNASYLGDDSALHLTLHFGLGVMIRVDHLLDLVCLLGSLSKTARY